MLGCGVFVCEMSATCAAKRAVHVDSRDQAMAKDLSSGPMAKGQLWKVDESYLQIVDLGKRLIHYKLMKKPDQKAVITRMIGIEALAVYLRSNEATLVV